MKWSDDIAYATGIIATDGNLTGGIRKSINITSKDFEIVNNCKKILNLPNKIGKKSNGPNKEKKYFVIQSRNRDIYDFLTKIGITPVKSKTIGTLRVPVKYFCDFLKGCIDGDGNICIFNHPESKSPQLKLRLYSASPKFLEWIKNIISKRIKVKGGWITYSKGIGTLSFGKSDSIKILDILYRNKNSYYLIRKYRIYKTFTGEW